MKTVQSADFLAPLVALSFWVLVVCQWGIIWYHLILSDIIWYYLILSDVIWYYLILFDTIWYHLISLCCNSPFYLLWFSGQLVPGQWMTTLLIFQVRLRNQKPHLISIFLRNLFKTDENNSPRPSCPRSVGEGSFLPNMVGRSPITDPLRPDWKHHNISSNNYTRNIFLE